MNQNSTRNTGEAYTDTFDARGDLYNAASLIHKTARDIERTILIDHLQIESHHLICDVPAGGGYLADGIRSLVDQPDQIVCVEPSKKFSEPISSDYVVQISPISSMLVNDNYFDRVGSLAGLHHVTDKRPFFHEAYRALKPGGMIAVGDVLAGTQVAKFLNGPVDEFTESGHEGVFIEESDFSNWFASAGFDVVTVDIREFHWTFETEDQMVDYCKSLFGLVKATKEQVRDELLGHFQIAHQDGKCLLPWSLIYGVGRKPS